MRLVSDPIFVGFGVDRDRIDSGSRVPGFWVWVDYSRTCIKMLWMSFVISALQESVSRIREKIAKMRAKLALFAPTIGVLGLKV